MTSYTFIILGALFVFCAIAVLLLTPIYFFLKREEQVSEQWTEEKLAQRLHQATSPNGASEAARAPEA